MAQPNVNELVSQITDYVNTFSLKPEEFTQAMSREHRTLQQSFTRLCLAWIEHCASIGYRYDDRNKASHEIACRIVEDYLACYLANPSEFLPHI